METPHKKQNADISLCESCNCMTKTIYKCGKCGAWKIKKHGEDGCKELFDYNSKVCGIDGLCESCKKRKLVGSVPQKGVQNGIPVIDLVTGHQIGVRNSETWLCTCGYINQLKDNFCHRCGEAYKEEAKWKKKKV